MKESRKNNNRYQVLDNGYCKCLYCNKIYCPKGIGTHIWRNHEEGQNFDPNRNYKNGSIKIWNKNLTKEDDSRVEKYSNTLKEKFRDGKIIHPMLGKNISNEHKEKISIALTKNNNGGKCKWYEISGIKVQGTWERDLAKKFIELGIKWRKIRTNSFTFHYKKEDNIKRYTPDFYLPEFDILLELKGYWWGDDKEKMRLVLEQNEINNLFIIEKEQFYCLLNCSNKEDFVDIIQSEE